MPKMEGVVVEVGQKLKSAIKAKLMEMGAYVDDELSNYVMVMVTNGRSKADMDRELQLFLGANTAAFTTWVHTVLSKMGHVYVTGGGVEDSSKKKGIDKKRKSKKSGRSSSDSEDDKKSKRKRKTSTSSDVKTKETKKHKQTKTILPSDSKESLFDDSAIDTSSSVLVDTKKSTTSVKTVTEKKQDSSNIVERKPNEDTANSIDEDDFLNIKEDFESGFLSDESVEGNTKTKTVTKPAEATVKAPSRKAEPTDKRIVTGVVIDRRYTQDKPAKINTTAVKETVVIKRSNEPGKTESCELDRAAGDATKKMEIDDSNVVRPTRKLLIRDRKLRSRTPSPVISKSKSNSPPSRARTKTTSIFTHCNNPSKSRSRSPNSRSRSRSRSRTVRGRRDSHSPLRKSAKRGIASRLRSPSPRLTKKRERSPSLVDARELINRKRAMIHGKQMVGMRRDADSSDEDDVDAKKMVTLGLVRLKNRENVKENVNLVDEEDDDDCNIVEDGKSYNKYEKFIVSKRDGKRSILVRSTSSLKRTIYAEENGTDKATNDEMKGGVSEDSKSQKTENAKLRKSVMNQIVKHIKDDQMVSMIKPTTTAVTVMTTTTTTTVTTTKGTTRMKASGTQSATNTLIRKAVADAHRSSREDTKKKELHENKSVPTKERPNDQVEEIVVDDDSDSKKNDSGTASDERMDDDRDCTSSPELRDGECSPKDTSHQNHEDNMSVENAEEYDPSQNIPRFVVTLTGLDPKTYPHEDMDLDLVEKDSEDARVRSKIAERCKYFPNCLAGDQCLYHHPVIPCKLFPNCKYGNSCLYIHPKCKFDSMCTRYDCTFTHTSPRIAAPVAPRHAPIPAMNTATPCKYYYNCTNPVCPFLHPKLCRFDRFCTNKMCTFSHTSRTHLSAFSKDKLKWCRKDVENKTDNAESKLENNETMVDNY